MKFKPEDFLGTQLVRDPHNLAAELANAKLEEWLAAAPVVYGYSHDGHLSFSNDHGERIYSHEARLVLIEPIVQESEERKLLRERVEFFDQCDPHGKLLSPGESLWLQRARKLLEKK